MVVGLLGNKSPYSNRFTLAFQSLKMMYDYNDGRGIVFATVTPISNSMVEMYTMQRYLQHDTLESLNLLAFDSWASTFGETVTAIELVSRML